LAYGSLAALGDQERKSFKERTLEAKKRSGCGSEKVDSLVGKEGGVNRRPYKVMK